MSGCMQCQLCESYQKYTLSGCLRVPRQSFTALFNSSHFPVVGSGVLSSELLRCGAARVIAWEGRDKFWSSLKVTSTHPSPVSSGSRQCNVVAMPMAQCVHMITALGQNPYI